MFRSLGKSKIAFVLAILFGISLFFFRGGERYSNLFNSDNVVASVSGTPISTSKFLRVMQMNVNQYSQMFGKPLNGEDIQAFQIHSMVLGQLVNNAVFENEFDNKGFLVDETVVAAETKKRFPNLYNKNNKINEQALNSFLSQQNLKIDDLVKIIDFEARSKVFDKLFFNINYPNKMEIVLNKYNQHSRNIDLIKINIKDFKLPNSDNLDLSIENKKIVEFFDQNIKSYINPEKRTVSYITIDKNNYTNEFTPSNNQIEKYYIDNKEFFLDSEKRDFIQFNFKTLEEAQKFRNSINSYKIEKVTKFANENGIIFNEFSKVSKDEVFEDLSKAIFGLQKNQISDIVKTPLANHIVIVNNIYPETQKTLDQSRKEITDILLQVELDSFILDLKNKINQQILDGFSLNEIASDNSLTIKTINNAEKFGDEIENDLVRREVISKGFATNKDFVSDMVDVDDNRSIIINVDKIENSKPYDFKEVFEIVSNDWMKSLKILEIEEKIDVLYTKNQTVENVYDDELVNEMSKRNFEIVFSSIDAEILNIDIRLDTIDYPSSLKNKLFSNDINQISLSIEGDDIYIAKVNSISFSNENENENFQQIFMLSELRSNFGAEIFKDKKISTNDNLIEALISQY